MSDYEVTPQTKDAMEFDSRSIQSNAVDFMDRTFPRQSEATDVRDHPADSGHTATEHHDGTVQDTVNTMKRMQQWDRATGQKGYSKTYSGPRAN